MKPLNLHPHEVRAALAGNLGMIVRPVKPQPPSYINELHGNELAERAPYRIEHPESGQIIGIGFQDDNEVFYKSPFKPGDKLWGRETWCFDIDICVEAGRVERSNWRTAYKVDETDRGSVKWKPSTQMPRWASRITIEITTLAVKQVAKITEAEAMACGFERLVLSPREIAGIAVHPMTGEYVDAFKAFWQKQYGDAQWAWFLSVKGAE